MVFVCKSGLKHQQADAVLAYVLGCVQAKLQQQLRNTEATEQLLQSELSSAQQQLQQAQQEVQRVTAEARAAADAATAQHHAELQQLQHQLGDEGASQVGCVGQLGRFWSEPLSCSFGCVVCWWWAGGSSPPVNMHYIDAWWGYCFSCVC